MRHALGQHSEDGAFPGDLLREAVPSGFSTPGPSSSTVLSRHGALRRVRRTAGRRRAGLTWTIPEEEALTALHPTYSNQDLAARLGRSHWAVVNRSRSLQLTRDQGDRHGRRRDGGRTWSSDEIELLRTLYPSLPCEDVAERLGRSLDGVKMKARRLKLRRSENWSPAEDRLLCDSYRNQSGARIAQRLGRTVAAVRARAVTLGVEPKVRSWTAEEVRFLRDSYGVLDLEALALELGHTRAATAKKARALGLAQYRHWSREDEQRLAQWYPCCPTRELADRLGRPYETVRDKAKRLGLRKRSPPAASDTISLGGHQGDGGNSRGDSPAAACPR